MEDLGNLDLANIRSLLALAHAEGESIMFELINDVMAKMTNINRPGFLSLLYPDLGTYQIA